MKQGNEMFPQSHRGNTDQLCSDWNRAGCSGAENHGPRLTIPPAVLAWAPLKGHVTPADQSQTLLLRAATTPRLRRTRGLRCCTVQKEKKILILLTLTECLLIVTFSVSHHAHRFLEMISGYLENKTL